MLVADVAALDRLAREIADDDEIAVDTEADSFWSYREKLCLLQLSTPRGDVLVDPLAGIDVAALAAVFAAPRPRKVFHDAEYDVALLKEAGIPAIAGLFDTRVAVSLLGSKTPGLSNVLRERYGIELDKRQQRSDWRQRPLSREQLDYARHDTRHLLRLARDLEPELAKRDLLEIFRFECERVGSTEPRRREFDPDDALRIRGARELDPGGLSALRELFVERDRIARERDLAAFRVVPNDLLVVLARHRPTDRRQLEKVRLPPRMRSTFGDAALDAIARARARGPWFPKARAAPPDEELAALERLRRWRTRTSEARALDATAVLNRQTLEEIARRRPRTLDELREIRGLAPWQLDQFGAEILRAIESAPPS
ncbi:MAG TPA: HRDC domain-containing protein [Planctomycetota bacterium]|nr:HRDC domain-containing protein [Planctomycetota bacterium]